MSLTPKRRDGDQTDNHPLETPEMGVWDRVRAVGRRLVDGVSRFLSLGGRSSEDSPETDQSGTDLRVVDEQDDRAMPVRATVGENEADTRPPTPSEQSAVQTQKQGERVRVYDPDNREAYISSDTWRPIER